MLANTKLTYKYKYNFSLFVQYSEVMKWLSDNNTSLEHIQNAAKLPALKQLLLECNIGAEKEGTDLLVKYFFVD